MSNIPPTQALHIRIYMQIYTYEFLRLFFIFVQLAEFLYY
jgi:hypothetical protein